MKLFFKKTVVISSMLGIAAIVAVPAMALASGYSVSGSVTGYTVVSVSQAAVICQNLPDAIAMQMTFCVRSFIGSAPMVSGIAAISSSSDGATISWTTDQASTTLLWYGNAMNSSSLVGYANPSQGYTTNHSITLSGINTGQGYTYMVGGNSASGALGYSTAQAFPNSGISGYNANVSVSNVGGGKATVNVSANLAVRSQIVYSTQGRTSMTAYSSATYATSSPIYLTNLDNNANYQGQVTLYGQNGSIVGTYPVTWNTR